MSATVTTIPATPVPRTWAGAPFAWNSPDAGAYVWGSAYETLQWFCDVDRSLSTLEVRSSNVSISKQESLGVIDTRSASLSKGIAEATLVSNSITSKSLEHVLPEVFSSTDVLTKEVGINRIDTINTAEVRSVYLEVNKEETFNTADSLTTITEFLLNFAENFLVEPFNLDDNSITESTKVISEAISVIPGEFSTYHKEIAETLLISEVVSRGMQYVRDLAEGLSVSEALAKTITVPRAESVQVMDLVRRGADAVISNYRLKDGNILSVQDEALKWHTQGPVGYTDFLIYNEGQYTYKDALFKVYLTNPDKHSAVISNIINIVDVPDVFDRGTAAIAVNGTSILFNRSFYIAPEVVVVLKGGTVISTPVVSNVTTTSFTVELFDSTGTSVAGTVSWSAHGY